MSFFEELKRRNVVRVGIAYLITAWLLVQVADILLETFAAPVWAMQFIVVLLVIGFPLALFFAWAFELTPEGVKREKDVERSKSITPQTGKKLDRAIIAGLVAVIAIMAVERFWFAGKEPEPDSPAAPALHSSAGERNLGPAPPDAGKAAQEERPSVAVIPFTAMSSGEDDGYFADGLTEEILNSLARLPELLVTARTSSFHFKGRDLPVPEIAATLGVQHVVEGSVRRSGERVRITAQLIRADDGFHLWSDTYDRTLEDVFAVQEEIAENIAATLDVVLDDAKRQVMRNAGIGDVEAFIAYQKGMEAFGRAHEKVEFISSQLALANEYFARTLEANPELTTVRLLKADQPGHVLMELSANFRDAAYPGEVADALARIREEYELAWRYAPPGNQRDILDVERAIFSDDWTGIAEKLDRALQPGECPTLNWTFEFAAAFGRAAQVAEKARETLACDPFNVIARFSSAFMAIHLGYPDRALQVVEEAEALGVLHPWIEDGRFYAMLALGRLEDPAVSRPKPRGSVLMFPRGILTASLKGDAAQARRLAEEYMDSPEANDWAALVAAAVIGDRERANRYAAAIDRHPGSAFVLNSAVHSCFCGAPFDLEVAPNYRARIEQSGLPWPPPAAIRFPAKDW